MLIKFYANTGTIDSKVEATFDFDDEETEQWNALNIFEKRNYVMSCLLDYGMLDFGWEIVK